MYGNQSIEIHSLGPNLWISHDWAGAQSWGSLGGHPWETGPPTGEQSPAKHN